MVRRLSTINVIEMSGDLGWGCIHSVYSFPYNTKGIEAAEKCFVEKIKQLCKLKKFEIDAEDIEDAIDENLFEYNDNYIFLEASS